MEKTAEEKESFDEIKVFASDKKLKVLGELLSNQSSRDIIKLLIEKEHYTNEIAKKLNLRVNLVIHHLRKMEDIGLVEIQNKKIIRKGDEHRFFKITKGMLIVPDKTELESKNGLLKRIFKEGVKISAVFLATLGFFQLFQRDISETGIDNKGIPDVELEDKIIEKILPYNINSMDIFWIIIIPIAILLTALFLVKKRKRTS